MEESYNTSAKITIISSVAAILILIAMGYLLYTKYSVKTVSYTGLGESDTEIPVQVTKDIIFSNQTLNSDKIEFVQRVIKGGGVNPGWVISLLETQPNVFTGRVIVDDGVYQHPVTLKEESTNIFVGKMKSKDGAEEIFAMKKDDSECTDEEGNIWKYKLSGSYGGTQFQGCGGDVVKEADSSPQ